MKILLNALGILIFFLNRYAGRTDKAQPFSGKKWLSENWEQLTIVALFDVALMLLVINGGLEFNFEKIAPMLPEGVKLAGDLSLCFLVGLLFAWLVYVGYKKMVKGK
jgi:Kef-type K+ transport system membrane component KefB